MKNAIFNILFLLFFSFFASNVKAINYEIQINNSGCSFDSIAIYGSGGWLFSIASVGTGSTNVACATLSGTATNIFYCKNGFIFSTPAPISPGVQCSGQPACNSEPCFNGTHFFSSSIATGMATFPCVGDLLTINIS